ncbi:MAG: hypothetical protein Ct9H300mP12_07360 [Acidimicrobiales bacterium]|nr:MAG: hypothetical protein Ct9H300mP12_07360 [Acidimicrobiales bacterium]
MPTIPRIISVDDHVVEPPDLWTTRLPAKYRDRGPRIERDTAIFNFEGGVFSYEKGVEGGKMCDWWIYDDLIYPFPKLSAAAGSTIWTLCPSPSMRSTRRAGSRPTAYRHGREPRRHLDLLPQRAASLLRPGVPRA